MKRVAAAATVLLVACATVRYGPFVRRWIEPPAPSALARPPIVPDRARCLEPPYFATSLVVSLAESEGDVLHGVGEARVEGQAGARQRALRVTVGQGPALDSTDGLTFLERHRQELHALPGVETSGFGSCGEDAGSSECARVGMLLCGQTAAELAGALHRIVARDAASAGHSVTFYVELVGAKGPRCQDDAGCEPEPYDTGKYRAGARRGVLSASPPSTPPECRSDRECRKAGCGNQCTPWPDAHHIGTCEYQVGLAAAFCGCVEEHCAWFVQ